MDAEATAERERLAANRRRRSTFLLLVTGVVVFVIFDSWPGTGKRSSDDGDQSAVSPGSLPPCP